jgi:hypothetical protein
LRRENDNESTEGLTDEDDAPALLPELISVTGDLWVLDKHRLGCGDATVVTDVEHLMAGEAADLVFTDPPYNVDYQGYTDQHLKIQADCMPAAQFQRFLADMCGSYRIASKPTGPGPRVARMCRAGRGARWRSWSHANCSGPGRGASWRGPSAREPRATPMKTGRARFKALVCSRPKARRDRVGTNNPLNVLRPGVLL